MSTHLQQQIFINVENKCVESTRLTFCYKILKAKTALWIHADQALWCLYKVPVIRKH